MRTARPRPFASPVQFLAFGFGAGLSPVAPGTVLFWFLAASPLWLYSLVLLAGGIAGIWICGWASEELGVHDHPGIVWDEFIGYGIALWAAPQDPGWMLAAFVAFRGYDIIKPWPISVLDRRMAGGAGIMVDDVVAGVMAWVTLQLAVVVT